MVSFHLAAVDHQQAHIYDRLSEALPRRFWAYRETESALAEKTAWTDESEQLLQETLLLDGTLTELLSTPRLTIDASSATPSAGQLLHRIRSRISKSQDAIPSLTIRPWTALVWSGGYCVCCCCQPTWRLSSFPPERFSAGSLTPTKIPWNASKSG